MVCRSQLRPLAVAHAKRKHLERMRVYGRVNLRVTTEQLAHDEALAEGGRGIGVEGRRIGDSVFNELGRGADEGGRGLLGDEEGGGVEWVAGGDEAVAIDEAM